MGVDSVVHPLLHPVPQEGPVQGGVAVTDKEQLWRRKRGVDVLHTQHQAGVGLTARRLGWASNEVRRVGAHC